MPFRLSSEARSYYKNVEDNSPRGEFDTLWDQYYLSAMAGIKARSRVPDDEAPTTDPFMDEVIQAYDDQKYEIYSALIVAEIERENIPWSQKEEIQELMLRILDSTSATRLTDEGAKTLNCYAEKGYQIIESEIPASLDFGEFLEEYYDLLDGIDESSIY